MSKDKGVQVKATATDPITYHLRVALRLWSAEYERSDGDRSDFADFVVNRLRLADGTDEHALIRFYRERSANIENAMNINRMKAAEGQKDEPQDG